MIKCIYITKIKTIMSTKAYFANFLFINFVKLDMVSYLVEIAYDVAICPRDNISDSPGVVPLLGAVVG